jgi:hypothetical protein
MFLAFVLVLFQVLKARSDVAALEREREDLTRELEQLRNLPLEGLELGTKAGGGH